MFIKVLTLLIVLSSILYPVLAWQDDTPSLSECSIDTHVHLQGSYVHQSPHTAVYW